MTDPFGPPFEVLRPRGDVSPVIVEVPHASLVLDPETMAFSIAPIRSIARDADLYVDLLVRDLIDVGVTVLVARRSRYVVDLNRDAADFDALAVDGGPHAKSPRGVVWRLTTENEPALFAPLTRGELERRLATVHTPYHATLRALCDETRERFGRAVLFCAHSMPSSGRRGHVDVGDGRADVVPGTRGRTTAGAAFIDLVDEVCAEHAYSVKHDDPYRGGYATTHYGRPAEGVHAIQIELARRVYMQEDTLLLDPEGAGRAKRLWRALVTRAAKLALA